MQVRTLAVASVSAFGPEGTVDGDNPQLATFATSGSQATPWRTDWYATPDFNGTQAGTGLLLDLGQPATVTNVRLSLGASSGASLQLRVGSTPVLADLQQVAASQSADGIVQLQIAAPQHARYLLVWFTHLPPDTAGTFQASVYGIGVQGRG